jgi:hypothetical protein
MTQRDDHLPDQFLVDGVAPSVIGGAGGPDPVTADFDPGVRGEPPTTPIPAQAPPGAPTAQGTAEQRKGWLGRMLGRP